MLIEYQGHLEGKDAPTHTVGNSGGLLAIEQSMEAAEKKKHDLKVMEMITLAAKGNLPALKVCTYPDEALGAFGFITPLLADFTQTYASAYVFSGGDLWSPPAANRKSRKYRGR